MLAWQVFTGAPKRIRFLNRPDSMFRHRVIDTACSCSCVFEKYRWASWRSSSHVPGSARLVLPWPDVLSRWQVWSNGRAVVWFCVVLFVKTGVSILRLDSSQDNPFLSGADRTGCFLCRGVIDARYKTVGFSGGFSSCQNSFGVFLKWKKLRKGQHPWITLWVFHFCLAETSIKRFKAFTRRDESCDMGDLHLLSIRV